MNKVDSTQQECIYLLHGFASAPKHPSDKVDVLERVFELPVKQLQYDSSGSFSHNIEQLKGQVNVTPLFFVGTSLGAFYASKLAEIFQAEAAMPIMLNPCHNPHRILRTLIGKHVNFVTGEEFTLTDSAVNSYKDISLINQDITIPRWILLNMDDELIDSHETKRLYDNSLKIFCFHHGGHRFANIASEEVMDALSIINNSYFFSGVSSD